MAVLTNAERREVWKIVMEQNIETVSIEKQNLRAIIDAVDQWVEDNQPSFNSAIPQPARTSLTQKQKVLILLWVVNKRFNV